MNTQAQERLLVVAGLVWLGDGELLVQRRAAHVSFGANRLELPGGKIERGEAPRAALVRELLEEWGAHTHELVVGRVVDVLHHAYLPAGPEVVMPVYDVDARCWGARWTEFIQPAAAAVPVALRTSDLVPGDFLPADLALMERVRRGDVRAPFG